MIMPLPLPYIDIVVFISGLFSIEYPIRKMFIVSFDIEQQQQKKNTQLLLF